MAWGDVWNVMRAPGAWEDQADGQYADYDGFAWYRCFVKVPETWAGSRLLLTVVSVSNVDEAFFNGDKVGSNGGMPPLYGNPASRLRRPAVIEPDQVRFGEANLIAFRVYNKEGKGGLLKGPIQLGRLEDAIDLSGQWDFRVGDRQDYGQWPEGDPSSLLLAFEKRHGALAAGGKGVVPADRGGREKDLASVEKHFEGNKNVHSNLEGKGDPKNPEVAKAALQVGHGLEVDLVLSEPLVRQPLYLDFDERGRLWVTQYIQYPKPAGLEVLTRDNHLRTVFDAVPSPPPYKKPEHQKFIGRDKITIHEDTNGDGVFDLHKTFLEGMNIVTSTTRGRGGVWVMNPPYLLFYPDADNDDVPDGDPTVHLSGFGLEDTHSVANSLKWGPDGWLYGATGSTVTARVRVTLDPGKAPLQFFGQTIWRYHPERHDFELFAQGGWNTFGVDFDDVGRLYSGTNGSMQAVHFVQGGFYQKGFGKHGPHTNPFAFDYFFGIPIEGKKHRLVHQWLDYSAPEIPQLQGKLVGPNCLANGVSVLERHPDGSTFRSVELEEAIATQDKWFRPIHTALGPDGAIYVADFYDARITHVDPRDNWDRDHGRVYRLRSPEVKPAKPMNLLAMNADALVDFLKHPNRHFRNTARRVLVDRKEQGIALSLRRQLREDDGQLALESLWTLHQLGQFDDETAIAALDHANAHVRLWAIRLLGDAMTEVPEALFQKMQSLALSDPLPEVASQLASTAQRLPWAQGMKLVHQLASGGKFTSDPFIPSQVWWALEEQVSRDAAAVMNYLKDREALWSTPLFETKLVRLLARRLASDPTEDNLKHAAALLGMAPNAFAAKEVVAGMQQGLQGITLSSVPKALDRALADLWKHGKPDASLVSFGMQLKSPSAFAFAQKMVRDRDVSDKDRLSVLKQLAERREASSSDVFLALANEGTESDIVRLAALNGLRRFQDPGIAKTLRGLLANSKGDLRETVISVIVGRQEWAPVLMEALEAETLAAKDVRLDHVIVMQGHEDPSLAEAIRKYWGVALQSNEASAERVARATKLTQLGSGDAARGQLIFKQACATCHRMDGEGGVIGPDLTGYDRSDENFFINAIANPNLAVREEYELVTVTLKASPGEASSTVLSGFVRELNDKTLKLADLSGNETTIALSEVLSKNNSAVSLMPEGLLDSLTDEQVRDLFAYIKKTP